MTGQLGYHAGPEVDPERVRWRIPQQENATAVIPPHTLHANIHMWSKIHIRSTIHPRVVLLNIDWYEHCTTLPLNELQKFVKNQNKQKLCWCDMFNQTNKSTICQTTRNSTQTLSATLKSIYVLIRNCILLANHKYDDDAQSYIFSFSDDTCWLLR